MQPGASVSTMAKLVQAFNNARPFIEGCLACWRSTRRQQIFPDEWNGEPVDLARARVIWHVIEHELRHGGELTLGMHRFPVDFPG